MARRSLVFLVMGTLLFLFHSVSSAAVPEMINYQGKLTTASGGCLNDTVEMTFSIYPDTLGSPADWTETQSQVIVQNGIFSVLLGSANSISASVFDGGIKYLGVTIEADPEMTPLKPMVSVPYAYRAGAADGGGGGNGWVDDGTVVRLDASSDSVGIGTSSPTAKLEVSGDVLISGKATIGFNHTNSGVGGFVAGTENFTSGSQPAVGGGNFNSATGSQATVGGGYLNGAIADWATVSGGHHNVSGDSAGTVGGGGYNKARGAYSVVGGGGGPVPSDSNQAFGRWSTVSGGHKNIASNTRSTVSGGTTNKASGDASSIGGGLGNTASDNWATVGGGSGNEAGGPASTVGGGTDNQCHGPYSVIPGGDQDTVTASAHYSMAFGQGVFVNADYNVVFFDGQNSGRLGINRDARESGPSYPIHVGTNSGNGDGAYLSPGGTWTDGSSRTFKDNFQPLDGTELLAGISSVPVEAWNYKDSDERHIGPMAEDFVAVFNVGVTRNDGSRDNQYLAARDVAGVALAGVKELVQQNRELQQIIEQLKQSNASLEARIAELEKNR
jgi:hypothetical protein